MKLRSIVVAGLIVTLLVIGPAAFAKGPSGAVIEGDGVAGTLVVNQPGEHGQGTAMSDLVQAVGFFELTFGDSKGVMDEAPTATLGKQRIVITWDMAADDVIVQEVYHHAEGGPVTYVAPGQGFWEETDETAGGWYRITGDIATPLIELGVDASAFDVPKAADEKAAPLEVKQPQPAAAAKSTVSDLAGGQAAQERAPLTERSSQTGIAIPLAIAVATLVAIMGTAAWVFRRRPILR